MSIVVDPAWWKTLFDEVYLVTDARSVDDAAVTRQEVDVFLALLPVTPDERLLDLCGGQGRHALELLRRGFRHCTVLDYSRSLLRVGAREAARRRYPLGFVQGDARRTALASASFDYVFIVGNSLGYLPEPDADGEILRESLRLLKPGGGLLLDVTDGGAVRRTMAPTAWHEIGDDVVVCRRREIVDGRICAREMVLSKTRGLIRDRTYGIRLYDGEELAALAARAGFDAVQIHTRGTRTRQGVDLGCMNHRLLVTARRPSAG